MSCTHPTTTSRSGPLLLPFHTFKTTAVRSGPHLLIFADPPGTELSPTSCDVALTPQLAPVPETAAAAAVSIAGVFDPFLGRGSPAPQGFICSRSGLCEKSPCSHLWHTKPLANRVRVLPASEFLRGIATVVKFSVLRFLYQLGGLSCIRRYVQLSGWRPTWA